MASMVTFQQAREAVARHLIPRWPGATYGKPYVADWGGEDEAGYSIPAGAREWLVEGHPGYVIMDWPTFLVDKRSGEVEERAYLEVADRLDAMEPVGTPPEHLT